MASILEHKFHAPLADIKMPARTGLLEVVSQIAPEENHHASQVHEAEKVIAVILIAHHQATEALQPREQPLDFPAPPIAAQPPSILGSGLLAILFMLCDHLNAHCG